MSLIIEKEIKILEVNVLELEKKLLEIWAKKHFEGDIHDIYYDFEWNELDENKRLFRLRKKGQENIYTIKKKNKSKNIKEAYEFETNVTDSEGFSESLLSYGMFKSREKKKFRISYSLENWVEFDIDKYEWMPALLEIEASSKEEIEKYIKILGLENHKKKKFGSRKLFEYYWKEYITHKKSSN